MVNANPTRRIGLFLDGGFFCNVSDYYEHHHPRQSRLSVRGVQDFVVSQVARWERVSERDCELIEGHYFRGRYPVTTATSRYKLERTARLEDELMTANIAAHFLPMGANDAEKGIDVWLAITALEAALVHNLDVIALLAGDGDYAPLVRMLKSHGKRILLLSWNYSDTDDQGRRWTAFTARSLSQGATYLVAMDNLIATAARQPKAIANRIFANPMPSLRLASSDAPALPHQNSDESDGMRQAG